jgi:hypothetical protein
MNLTPRPGHGYQDINIGGSSRVHMGDAYHHHGPSSDERALSAILESLSYPGMYDRRGALAEAHEGTFAWSLQEEKPRVLEYDDPDVCYTGEHQKSDAGFKAWLGDMDQGLFCIMGKPGSGKSTFMYVGHVEPVSRVHADSAQEYSLFVQEITCREH